MSTTAHRTPGETFAGYTQLVTMVCGACGITFAMPEQKQQECLSDHSQGWYFPNGHSSSIDYDCLRCGTAREFGAWPDDGPDRFRRWLALKLCWPWVIGRRRV